MPRKRDDRSKPAVETAVEPPSAAKAPEEPEAEIEVGAAPPSTAAPSAAQPSATQPSVAPPSPEAAGVDPLLDAVFSDDFERSGGSAELGPNWRATSPVWRLSNGRLCGDNAKNHPVWLARRLPRNAMIEFQALTESPDGDIKAEFWGDGRSSASGQSYTDATSYLTIFGGWKNKFHVLARRDEHAPDRREIKLVPGGADLITGTVIPHRVYQFRVERRDGHAVRWQVDDMDILTYRDDEPLQGPGHEHFGFNDWQVRVCFDQLRVTPLPD
ncbi:MAG TPA: hypothetical protein VMG12_08880 [Polyangiaceae bacterium]|nr:hypothetical protein [Polyangiaceae bacterium]